MTLTERDIELLLLLEERGPVPLELLARRFFARNPFTGALNEEPLKACERRIKTLATAGHVVRRRAPSTVPGRLAVVVVERAHAPSASRAAPAAAPEARTRGHDAQTAEALERAEAYIKARGGRVVTVKLDRALRREAQRGRWLRRGDRFRPLADAVIVADVPSAVGGTRRVRIALEYATSKYTDEDIRTKHESFGDPREYDEALWFVDRASTKARVERITGKPCIVI